MNKHEAMSAYFKPIVEQLTGEPLDFNFSDSAPEGVSLMTEYSDRVVKQYVHGGAVKAYGFRIVWTKAYSADHDDLNLEAMSFAQAFMDIIERKNKTEDFPDFPDNCAVEKLEVLQNMPNLAGINEAQSLARYQIPGQIIYFESED